MRRVRRPRIGCWTLSVAILVVLALTAYAGKLMLDSLFMRTTWDRPDPPTTSDLARLRDRSSHPTYWLGLRTDRPLSVAEPASSARDSLVFTYGQFCEELDPGSGLSCTDHGEVFNQRRTVTILREVGPYQGMPSDRECWHPVGRAWVLACERSWRPTLWTADRVVEFSRTRPGTDDLDYDRLPWRQTIRELQRFDAAGSGPKFPATTRFTCAERHVMSRRDRAGMPPALRARGC
jgi:hypothetical protein